MITDIENERKCSEKYCSVIGWIIANCVALFFVVIGLLAVSDDINMPKSIGWTYLGGGLFIFIFEVVIFYCFKPSVCCLCKCKIREEGEELV